MKPISFKEQNCTFAKNQKQYLPLPAFKDGVHGGRVISCWQLSITERLKVLFTGKIWDYRLTFGKPLQPIKLLSFNPFKVKVKKVNNHA